jgi:N6-adenosine-specific RNA methylase IME4
MVGKPHEGRRKALTPTQRQKRWRAKKKRLATGAEKRERREARMRAMNERALADREQRYGVIYADPPWQFEPRSRITGMDRAADNHYPTMTLDEIKALDVPAAPDCALFLWSTAPMRKQAMEVMEAWGFEHRSEIVWVKDRVGTGYWFRNKHETLLLGVRGDVPAPVPGTQLPSVIEAPVGQHSQKPEVFAAGIERMFPDVLKLEMFARTARPGWDVWGNEAPQDQAA